MARKMGWHIMHRFEGNPDWQELNRLIAFDSGNDEPYCGSEEDYQQAVKEGWIKFDGKVTTVWADGEYEEPDDRKYAYDQEYIKKNLKRVLITFNQNSKADMDIYEWLNQQTGSKVAYIKSLILTDMKKGEKTMKFYHIKPEYLDQFEGGDATDADRILTSTDVEYFSQDWEKPVSELLEMLEQIDADDAATAAQAILDAGNFNAAVSLMDDDLRETIHAENAPCSDLVFLTVYIIRHQEQFNESFTVA